MGNTLYAFTGRDLTNSVGGIDAAAFFADAKTCKNLKALFASFYHAGVNFKAVTNVEVCDVFELLVFDFIDDVHGLAMS